LIQFWLEVDKAVVYWIAVFFGDGVVNDSELLSYCESISSGNELNVTSNAAV